MASDNRWLPKYTDYELSPYTGLSRDSWLDAGRYMLEGVFRHIDSIDKPVVMPRRETDVTYPHKTSTGEALIAEQKAEIFEGLTRSFFIGSVMIHNDPELTINGIKLADYYRHQIYKSCCIKDDPAYVGTYEELHVGKFADDPIKPFQQTVETCALVIGLDACADEVWNRYSDKEKDDIAAFLKSYAYNPTVPQNWRLFNMLDLAFLHKYGYEIDDEIMGDHAQAILNYYVGDGWYRDGQCFDYYSCWAFNVYGPIWCNWYGYEKMPYVASKIEEASNALMKTYADMFDNDGYTNMWGRSCIYRNAATSAFDANMFLRNSEANPGLARRICSGSLLQFLTRDDFMWNGIPTLGLYDQFTPLVQGYSCAESPFWLGKAFLCLHLPADHPFWTSKEDENSFDRLKEHEVKETVLDGPALCFTNHKDNGETILRSAKVFKTAGDMHGMWNYNKLSYNSKYPWEATSDHVSQQPSKDISKECNENDESGSSSHIGLPVESQMYVIYDEHTGKSLYPNAIFWSGQREGLLYRRAFFDYKVEDERHWVQSMDLADFPVSNGLMRVDKLALFKRPVTVTLGSYGFPDNGTEIIRRDKDGAKAIILKGTDHMGKEKQLAMTIYSGWEDIDIVRSTGTNPDSNKSIVVYASLYSGPKLYDASKPYVLISQTITKESLEDFTDDELFPVKDIKYTDPWNSGAFGPVTITMKDGQVRTATFEGIEANLQL